MGAVSSRNEPEDSDLSEGSIPSTPILAPVPRLRRLEELDPRSPSANIMRTPIDILRTPTSRAQPPSKSPLQVLLDDPRSPTFGVERTPIVINGSKRIDFRPKLLESVPIAAKTPENKRNSLAGLLETNIDFHETDLDEVLRKKTPQRFTITEEQEAEAPDASNKEDPDNMDADAATATPELREEVNQEVALPDLIKDEDMIPPAVDEFDKKLTHLIYEDKITKESPKGNAMRDGRVPLGVRNQNKAISRLRVSDKPRSRIPVARAVKPKAKFGDIHSENVPPEHGAAGDQLNLRSRWGAEDSLVI